MSSFRPRGVASLKISNRERQRRANRAIESAAAAEVLVKLLLAQAGGEVTIAKGTASQVTADSTIEVVPNPNVEGEVVIRLLLGKDDEQAIVAPERVIEVPAEGATDVL